MKILKYFFATLFFISFLACENEVDLNAEFVDTPVVYALINPNVDSQFVKVNKAFLKDGESAIDLAQDPNNLYYQNLRVFLINKNRKDTLSLSSINRRKDEGFFTSEDNRVYYTNDNVLPNAEYELKVIQDDGKTTTALTNTLDVTEIVRPRVNRDNERPLPFVRSLGPGAYIDYLFSFAVDQNHAKIQVQMIFNYLEEINGNLIPKSVDVPVGSIVNSKLESTVLEINFSGQRFYETVAAKVAASSSRKVVPLKDYITIEIYAVDQTYVQYSDLNGPLDGIAQVRPEFTNINNGIGIFASRSETIAINGLLAASNNQWDSRKELFNGPITGAIGFEDP